MVGKVSLLSFRFAVIYESFYAIFAFFSVLSTIGVCGLRCAVNELITYPDKSSNRMFFECLVRCMWRRHLTVTDYCNYVFAFDPMVAIGLHIDTPSKGSMDCSRRLLQEEMKWKEGKHWLDRWSVQKVRYWWVSAVMELNFSLSSLDCDSRV